MLGDTPTAVWIVAIVFGLSLPVWGFVWFTIAFMIAESTPKQIILEKLLKLLTAYPLVEAALGIGAWVCWSRDLPLVAILLTVAFGGTASVVFCIPVLWLFLMRGSYHRK